VKWTAFLLLLACNDPPASPDARTPDRDAQIVDAYRMDAPRVDANVVDANAVDADAVDANLIDASPTPACDLAAAYDFASFSGIATEIDELVAIPSPDLLRVYVTRNTSGHFDVYMYTRGTPDETFGSETPLEELNTDGQDVLSWLSPDGRTAYLARDGDIFVATRASEDATFDTIEAVDDVNSGGNDGDPFLAPSGTLYFASDVDGTYALYSAAPATPGRFDPPVLIAELDTGGAEVRPVLTDDERTIFFTRAAHLFSATRDTPAASFGPVSERTDLVGEAFSTTLASWISGDACLIAITTDGISGPAGLEPFLFAKPAL
jgi:hypothetical protein